MDLSLYDVIQGAVVSGKAQLINEGSQSLVIKVHPASNKPMIKQAVEKFFDVKVEKVRVIIRKGKNRLVKRRKVTGKLEKKAIVTLVEGYKVDMFGQSEVGTSDAPVAAAPKQAKEAATK